MTIRVMGIMAMTGTTGFFAASAVAVLEPIDEIRCTASESVRSRFVRGLRESMSGGGEIGRKLFYL